MQQITWENTMGLARDITTRYTSIESSFYDRTMARAVRSNQAGLVESLLADVPIGGSVLDVGSGGGQLAIAIARRSPDVRVIGVDLSPDQVARAGERVDGVAQRVRFQVGSAENLEFPDNHFSTVVSVGSIKHWGDRARGLAEMVRVLRPGGRLTVLEIDRGCTFPSASNYIARANLPRLARLPVLLHFRTFIAGQSLDLEEARLLADELELSNVSVSRISDDPTLLIVGRK
ncbi:class I SAM-dependent methyltransferase [Nocardia sp. CA-129566]|uniref:class I SAM-dependent methyltransferase n=1 Tax=Nocardia sp. CA-129566 TaxID=3239976 RepID=UPI003D9715BF